MEEDRNNAVPGHDVRRGSDSLFERTLQRDFSTVRPDASTLRVGPFFFPGPAVSPERRAAPPGAFEPQPLRSERIMKNIQLAVRVDGTNPFHHLWNNNGTWWCHLTIHRPDHTSERVRVSLKTRDLAAACRKRDRLFDGLIQAGKGVAA
jgi:hypothetical protein